MTTSPARVSALAAAALVSVLGLAACGSSDSGDSGASADPDTVTTITEGKLTVCTHLPYKPFQSKEGDKIVGFDVDLMDLVAKKLNLQQEIVDIEFAQITSGAAFAAKKCDAAAGGTTITDERKNALTFSDPYFDATQALITKKGAGFKDLAALKGKKLGVQTDTTGQKYAEDNAAKFGYTPVVFDDLSQELAGMAAGRVDAAINDNGVLLDYVKSNPDAEVVTEFDTGEQYGLMFPKTGADKLVSTTNEVLKAAKADGSYNTIYKKWFGVDAPK